MGTRGRIFISYRRDDVPGDARGICDRLERRLGKANIFMDVDSLLAGQRFDRELDKALSQCDVLIAVIGPRWMASLSEHAHGGERDFVHDEIAAALKRDIVVIPTLVGREGHMPSLPRKDDLPQDIRDLVLYQKHDIAHESFNRDADHLTAAITSVLLGGGRRTMPWKAIAISGATGLALIVALLGYQMDVFSRTGSGKNLQAPGAEDEQARRAGITNCDRLAASPFDPTRPSGVVGVDLYQIDTGAATAACSEAMASYPEVARFVLQSGRAAFARKDYTQAAELFRKAIAKNNVAATATLGYLYHSGLGVARDDAQARNWYEKGAALGNVVAMSNLGLLYENGTGVTQNYAEANRWYEKAAALGYVDAMTNLGNQYYYGRGVTRDYAEARKWFEKAAVLGAASAMNALGIIYDNGLGVARDRQLARQWYQEAANAGDDEAKAKLEAFK